MTDKKENAATIDIETAGNTVDVDTLGATVLSLAIRGDASASYAVDAKLTRGSNWIQGVATYSGSADYDDTITTGYPKLRVRCTSGTGTAGDAADVTLSAGGG